MHRLAIFLLIAAIVRGGHIAAFPQIVWGMNHLTASTAKAILTGGLTETAIPLPMLPPAVLALLASLLDAPPGRLIPGVMVAASVLDAAAFWAWIGSVGLSRRVRWVAAACYLAVPFLCGSTGLGSVQTMLGGTLLLTAATLINTTLRTASSTSAALLAAAILPVASVRTELLVMLPIVTGLTLLAGPSGAGKLAVAAVLVGLIASTIAALTLRTVTGQTPQLSDGRYACWTFLDGTPEAWLGPDDDSEFERRAVGLRYFGTPADHDDSLRQMVLANPGRSAAKFVLSLPRWARQLGRRDQVLPIYAAAFALVGIAAMLLSPHAARRRQLLRLVALIVATLPVAAVMIHAEYLRPAIHAVLVLIAVGVDAIAAVVVRLTRRRIGRPIVLGLTVCLVIGMTLLASKSGAHLSDRTPPEDLATLVDAADATGTIAIAPDDPVVDSLTRTPLVNRSLGRHDLPGEVPPRGLDVFAAVASDQQRPTVVVLWSRGQPLETEPWLALGYAIRRTNEVGELHVVILDQ